MFSDTRFRWALRFGRLEHALSRILFISLLLTYLDYRFPLYELQYFLLANIVLWLGYWCSHLAEKKLYPRNFR